MSPFTAACESIHRAEVEREIVMAVQRFLASVPQAQRDQLPWGLFATPVANVGDVALWAFQMAGHREAADELPVGPTYGQTVEIFKRAAARLVELRKMESPSAPRSFLRGQG